MYQQTPFSVSPVADVEADLAELRAFNPSLERLFLVNADPFCLSTRRLVEIGKLVRKYLPNIKTLTCYASINNLKNKSVEDLMLLKSLGYDDLHIGLETAYEPALKMIHKGFTVDEAREQLQKVLAAGMKWDALLMLGVAGHTNGIVNTTITAEFLNELKPYMVSIMPTGVFPGSQLEAFKERGEYIECTELEMIEEEKLLLNSLKIDHCYFFGSHVNNLIPVSGLLPDQKEAIIARIDDEISQIDSEILHHVKLRGSV
jgi:radical SAM superfamily enzyme YgiQ (UPF0313 family)